MANEQTIKRYWGQTERGKLYEGRSICNGNPKIIIFAHIAFILIKLSASWLCRRKNILVQLLPY